MRALSALGGEADQRALSAELGAPSTERAMAAAWALGAARRSELALELAHAAQAFQDREDGPGSAARASNARNAALAALCGLLSAPGMAPRIAAAAGELTQAVDALGNEPGASPEQRVRCALVLGTLGAHAGEPAGAEAAGRAAARLLDGGATEVEVAQAAARALVRCRAALPAVDWSRELHAREGRARFELALAVAEGAGYAAAAPVILAALENERSDSRALDFGAPDRRRAIRALAFAGDAESATLLRRLAEKDPDPLNRRLAREALPDGQ